MRAGYGRDQSGLFPPSLSGHLALDVGFSEGEFTWFLSFFSGYFPSNFGLPVRKE